MKHNIKITSAATAIALLLNTGIVSAAVTSLHYDAEKEYLTISGNADFGGQGVGLEILKGGVTEEAFKTANGTAQFEMLDYIKEIKSNDDGSYTFALGFPGDSKKHVVRVKNGLQGKVETYNITTASKTEFDNAFAEINAATATNIKTVLAKNLDVLGLDGESFNALPVNPTDYQNAMAIRILNRRNAMQNKVFPTFASLETVFGEELAVESVNAATVTTTEDVLEKYEIVLGLKTQDAYDVFETMTAEVKNKVYANLTAKDYTSVDGAVEGFALAVVNAEFTSAAGYDELYDMIPKCAKALGINTPKYNALSKENKLNVCNDAAEQLTSGSITKDSFESILETAASKYKKSDKPTQGGGTGGGGGGGIGSTPEVTFQNTPAEESEYSFGDLQQVSWAADCIEELAELNIVCGKAAGVFAPNDYVTREEFVKMVVLAFNINSSSGEADFTDVNDGDWYKEYIDRVVGAGIIQGMGDGRFGVGENITRQDIAVILNNVLSDKVTERAYAFEDSAEISDYAKDAVNAMRYLSIISGYEDNTFRPRNNATRAEAAKLLYNVMQAVK